MEPKRAWGAFSIIIVLVDAIAVALMIDLGYDLLLVLAVALIALLVYFYVLYKRYHVEVVPENDILQFEDPEDLRILSAIYGLSAEGEETDLRERLMAFAKAHGDSAFVWVAPKTVLFFGTALEMPPAQRVAATRSSKSSLIQKKADAMRPRIKICPICDAEARESGSTCEECGADLELYVALGESRVGRLMLSQKAGKVRRKSRYEVPSLREN